MQDEAYDVVSKRLDVLERKLKFRETACLVCLLILVVSSLAVLQRAQAQGIAPKTIRSERFELVDSNGRTTLDMTLAADGTPRLTLLGKDGKARISLMLDGADSPVIQLSDAAGRHQLSLDVREGVGPAIALRDTERDSGVMLTSDRKGVAALGFIGEHARSQIELGINPDGSVVLKLHDKEGNVVFSAPQASKDAP